jgi:ABC-2 type transport system permease protein
MTSVPSKSKQNESRDYFSELLRVEAKLALRTPIGLGGGLGIATVLLVVFGLIGVASPGNVAGTNLTIIDLYVPTLMAISFTFLGIYSLPYTMVRYREMGWLRRVSLTPESPSRLLAAQTIINLVVALAAILILVFGSELIFGASLHASVPYFVLSIVLSIAELFSLGLIVAAVVPTQQICSAVSGVLMFLSFFLSGLWVQPSQVGGIVATIMYYSPPGAAVSALLSSAFNSTPSYTSIVTMIVYTAIFAFVAIRSFRWE